MNQANTALKGLGLFSRTLYIQDVDRAANSLFKLLAYNAVSGNIGLEIVYDTDNNRGVIATTGTEKDLRITPTGNLILNPAETGVRIGSTDAPNVALDVTGDTQI